MHGQPGLERSETADEVRTTNQEASGHGIEFDAEDHDVAGA